MARKQSALPVVVAGIGASAGGLEAFGRLLENLPGDTGMAFVLIQHMDPDHESMLGNLLSSKTPIPVLEVTDGAEPRANHIYVIPPNKRMTLKAGKLRLSERRRDGRPHMPVDEFFIALAESRGSRAIGVVLSGTGNDGTRGLKAIKAAGGITFAQDQDSAKFYGMPASAIAAGCVDFSLPPGKIAEELPRVLDHFYVRSTPSMEELQQPLDGELEQICATLRGTTGIDFMNYKPATIRRRITRRMALHRMTTIGQYAKLVETEATEAKQLYEDILIHVTSFFREPDLFRALQETVLSEIVEDRNPHEAIRIWAPGCSTGEEVYSIAMALLEHLGEKQLAVPFQIFGTDISERAIEVARTGIYPESALVEVSPERRRRFFEQVNGNFQVIKLIREGCVFARHDLAADPPFSRLDLISCRNVLIYLGAELQKRIMATFHYALRTDGFLVTGKSEIMSGHANLFSIRDKKLKIFTRKPVATPAIPHFRDLAATVAGSTGKPIGERVALDREKEVEREVDRILWRRYKGAGLVLDADMQIMHFRGSIGPYLAPESGEASFDIEKMIRRELLIELTTAVQAARRDSITVRREDLRFRLDGTLRTVNLEVIPLQRRDSNRPHFAVFFEHVEDTSAAKRKQAPAGGPKDNQDETSSDELERELSCTRDHLQSAIQEYERTNEELRAANEEILSSNEELQSTNEELETAKEELQSTNEELTTVNEEQQNRNIELAALADDLNNLFNAVSLPILFLGYDMRIRRFTSAAAEVFHLIPGDIGRPLSDFRSKIEVRDWEDLLFEAVEHIREVEREVEDDRGRWWRTIIRPYKTSEKKIEGVLIILTEITDRKRRESDMEERVQLLSKSTREVICLHDLEGRCTYVSPSSQEVIGFEPQELVGRKPWELAHPSDRERLLEEHYGRVLKGEFVPPVTYRMRKKTGDDIWMETVTQPVFEGGEVVKMRSGSWDVTDRVETRELADQRMGEVQRLMEALLRSQEEERGRIARDLHDDIAQQLAYVSMQTETLAQKPEFAPAAESGLWKIRDDIGEVTEKLRVIAHQLHPSAMEHLGPAASLSSLCEEIGRAANLKIRFHASGDVPSKVPQGVGLCLYRVLQEGLHNVTKHARAKTVNVRFSRVKSGIRLTIRDDGKGFKMENIRGRKGLGLISMKERTDLAGGNLKLESRPGGGVRIQIDFPFEDEGDSEE